jgi:hypothetical protein
MTKQEIEDLKSKMITVTDIENKIKKLDFLITAINNLAGDKVTVLVGTSGEPVFQDKGSEEAEQIRIAVRDILINRRDNYRMQLAEL